MRPAGSRTLILGEELMKTQLFQTLESHTHLGHINEFGLYQQAAERGVQWCLSRQNPDGSIQMEEDCLDGIYKFPAAFATLGHYVEAGKLLNFLENHTLTDNGDLMFPAGKFA